MENNYWRYKDINCGGRVADSGAEEDYWRVKDGIHSACAFLNTDGGWLIFGEAHWLD